MPEAGIADVLNVVANVPFAPMLTTLGVELMVIVTVSLVGGNIAPAEIVPARLIELVPAGMLCDAVRLLKVVDSSCTTREKLCIVVPAVLDAVKVTLEVPTAVGVPPSIPVTVFNVTPLGKVPALSFGVGNPVAVTAKLPGMLTVNLVVAALVNTGACVGGISAVGGKATTTSLNCLV